MEGSPPRTWLETERSRKSGFIDLVVENLHQTVILNIECKRVQDATWQFLLPKPHDSHRHHFKFWVSSGSRSNLTYFDWVDLTIEPTSYESGFCVVAGQDAKSRPMLERIAATVVESTEALAEEESGLLAMQKTERLRMYISVIVTTANLEVCKFDPDLIDLKTGTIAGADYESVPFIRFRKQLSVRSNISDNMEWSEGLKSIANSKEHSVLVVQASEIIPLLNEFEISKEIGSVISRAS